jgi:hypothetical protein
MKAKQPTPVLSLSQCQLTVMEMHKLKAQINAMEKDYKAKQATLIGSLGGMHLRIIEFNEFRCAVVRAMRRTIPWREIAVGLARQLWDKAGVKRWARSLVKTYPKKAVGPSVRITTKGEKEDKE